MLGVGEHKAHRVRRGTLPTLYCIVYSVSGSSSQTQQYGVWAQAYVQPSTWKCDIWCNMTIKTVIKYVTMHWWKKIDAVKEHCAEWKTSFCSSITVGIEWASVCWAVLNDYTFFICAVGLWVYLILKMDFLWGKSKWLFAVIWKVDSGVLLLASVL